MNNFYKLPAIKRDASSFRNCHDAEVSGAGTATAEFESREIVRDGELRCDGATAVTSLEHLARLDDERTGDCVPHAGDGDTRLKDLLPEAEPFKDTKTADVLAAANTEKGRK